MRKLIHRSASNVFTSSRTAVVALALVVAGAAFTPSAKAQPRYDYGDGGYEWGERYYRRRRPVPYHHYYGPYRHYGPYNYYRPNYYRPNGYSYPRNTYYQEYYRRSYSQRPYYVQSPPVVYSPFNYLSFSYSPYVGGAPYYTRQSPGISLFFPLEF
jgi:hypothetical protein